MDMDMDMDMAMDMAMDMDMDMELCTLSPFSSQPRRPPLDLLRQQLLRQVIAVA